MAQTDKSSKIYILAHKITIISAIEQQIVKKSANYLHFVNSTLQNRHRMIEYKNVLKTRARMRAG
jgi:hypothetical protein